MDALTHVFPEVIELDPNLVITREDIWQWSNEAGIRAATADHGSETFEALGRVTLVARMEGEHQIGVSCDLLRELHTRGKLSLALRALVQIAIDAGVERLKERR